MGKPRILCMAVLFVAVFTFVLRSAAQTTYMSTGLVSVQMGNVDCSQRGFATGATCQLGTVYNCPNADPLDFLFAVIQPTNGPSKGTIALLSGFGGTQATQAPDQGNSFVTSYTKAGYTVLQVAWGGTHGGVDWELTNAPNGTHPFNIRNAACRPASLLLWAYNNPNIYTGGGKCVQGFSAGAGATAFAVAWYGAADQTIGYLDKLLLMSGPELADVNQGCQINSSGFNNDYITNICPPGGPQIGCSGWSNLLQPQPYHLEFSPDAADAVQRWSGSLPPACANNSGNSSGWTCNPQGLQCNDTIWQHMSIVDLPAQNGLPSFNYPKTAVSAFLCESTIGAGNNSESQGDLFYLNFTSASQVGNLPFNIFAVTGCPSAEDVNGGLAVTANLDGFDAIVKDMTDPVVGCKSHH